LRYTLLNVEGVTEEALETIKNQMRFMDMTIGYHINYQNPNLNRNSTEADLVYEDGLKC
jgi:hypothetical protein